MFEINIIKKAADFYYCSGKLAKFRYASYYEKLDVSDDIIFVESFHGDGIMGNPFYLLKEICVDDRLSNYKIYVGAAKKSIGNIRSLLDSHGMERVGIAQKNTKLYCKLLATAKYLISNVTFPTYFIKKKGQIYLNTWHGTPLKGLGRSILDNPIGIGNVQRNFLMSDYLLYPNRYTFEKMREDHMIGPYYRGQYILSGYPRNDILFDTQRADKLKKMLGLADKRIVIYMPTWRENKLENNENSHVGILSETLEKLDSGIENNTVIMAKLHHLAEENVDFSKYSRVIPFPDEYETYEVLAMADCLITDYSSVMFDFANTGRKIILHAYDCEEYQNTRSMYFGIEKLPFEITSTAEELVNAVNSSSKQKNYSDAMRDFTAYDHPNSSKDLIEYVFFGNQSDRMTVIEGSEYHNGKKNVLLYSGSLAKNGLTTAFMGIISHIDPTENNYLITFYQSITTPNQMMLNRFDKRLNYIPMTRGKTITYFEAFCQYLYFNLNINCGFTLRAVEKSSSREAKRCFCGIHFDKAVHYTGYEKHIIHLIGSMDAEKIIYTHSNLMRERKLNRGVHYNSLVRAYKIFDKIVIIRDSMRDEIAENVSGVDMEKIHVAHNLNNIEYIKNRALEDVVFNDDTYCNVSLDRLNEILNDKQAAKYINIARFSEEKALDRLIDAFSEFNEDYSDAYLIIVGGGGNKFDDIRTFVEINHLDRVILVKSIENPYPILNKCDAFILSSYYEGLPMTIMEALILNKPVICTDITGPREFLKSNGCGFLVESSEEGLVDGFYTYVDGRLKSLKKFDAEEFNKKALAEFCELLQ